MSETNFQGREAVNIGGGKAAVIGGGQVVVIGGGQVVVIGGGPAGSACAIALAKQGRKTLLIEKQAGPGHKVCGEFLSFEACRYLEALGVSPAALGAVKVTKTRLICGDHAAIAALPFEGMSLSRLKLDECLLEKAREAGVEIRRGRTVTGLQGAGEGEGFRVATDDGAVVGARAVFLATGKHDLPGFKRPQPPGADLIGFKMHYQASAADMAEATDIILFPGGYAGFERVEGGISNLCLVVRKSFYAACDKNWETLLSKIAAVTPGFRDRLAAPCWAKPLAIYPLPYGFIYQPQPSENKNLYRLGDQMAVIPSFSGDGISIALHTAALAAAAFLTTDAAQYHRTAAGQLKTQMRWARGFASLLETPLSQKPLIAACRAFPALISFAAAKTRLRDAA